MRETMIVYGVVIFVALLLGAFFAFGAAQQGVRDNYDRDIASGAPILIDGDVYRCEVLLEGVGG